MRASEPSFILLEEWTEHSLGWSYFPKGSVTPNKRKRVLPAPNEDFVRMVDVMKVRRTMSGAVGPNSDDDGNDEVESEIEVGDEIQDYILVKVDDSLNKVLIDEWVVVICGNLWYFGWDIILPGVVVRGVLILLHLMTMHCCKLTTLSKYVLNVLAWRVWR
jgi:hypothetical protein